MTERFVAGAGTSKLGRWTPLAGVAAVVLIVVGVVAGAFGGPEPNEGTGQEWLTYFRDNETQIYLSGLVFAIGVIVFLWFLGGLRTALLAAEAAAGQWAAVAFGAGIAMAAMLMAIVAPGAAGAFANDALEPAAAQSLGLMSFIFFIGAQVFGAAFLAATALAALRSGQLPVWLAWATLAVAVVLLTPIGFLALLIGFPLWVLAVSVLLWRKGRSARST
jgi:hypothetical protein